MSLTEVNKKNYIRRSDRNLVIPWDDPYPNINAVLTEEQQIFLKTLNIIEAKNRNFEIFFFVDRIILFCLIKYLI